MAARTHPIPGQQALAEMGFQRGALCESPALQAAIHGAHLALSVLKSDGNLDPGRTDVWRVSRSGKGSWGKPAWDAIERQYSTSK